MKTFICSILSSLTLLLGCGSSKPDIPHTNKPSQRLPNTIPLIYQDTQFNYWFVSDSLICFNGKDMIKYPRKTSVLKDQIVQINEDVHGNIYFNSLSGVVKFNGQKFLELPISKTASKNEWKQEKNDLWFRANFDSSGVFRYDGDSLCYLEFPPHPLEKKHSRTSGSFSLMGVYYIYIDTCGKPWFGTSDLGVAYFDGKNVNWIYEEELTELDDGPAPGVRKIIQDRNGDFWFNNDISHKYHINSSDSIFKYQKLEGIDLSQHSLHPFYMSIETDTGGNMWFLSYNEGIWKFDGKETQHFSIPKENALLFSLQRDRKEKLWVGTHNSSACFFNGTSFERFN